MLLLQSESSSRGRDESVTLTCTAAEVTAFGAGRSASHGCLEPLRLSRLTLFFFLFHSSFGLFCRLVSPKLRAAEAELGTQSACPSMLLKPVFLERGDATTLL